MSADPRFDSDDYGPDGNEITAAAMQVMVAAGTGDEAAVAAWLDGGGRVDATFDAPGGSARGLTMLMVASTQGQERLVETLLRRGAAVDLQNSAGWSALMLAARNGHAAIVRRLLRAGAQMGRRSVNGDTALQHAKREGHVECVRAFTEHLEAVAAARRGSTAAGAWTRRGINRMALCVATQCC